MKISVITVSYNSANTISDTIESVHCQSYKNFEHIIIDGGSEDGTIAILNLNLNYFSHFISEPDEGIYDALNKGLSISNGDILCLLHSDDFYPTNKVFEQVVSIFSDPTVDAVYGDLDYVSSCDANRVIRKWRPGFFEKKNLYWGWMPPHPTLFIRRSSFLKTGFFDLQYSISADYDFIIRLFLDPNFKSIYIPETLVKMRVGGVSNRSLMMLIKKSYEDFLIIRRNHIGGIFTLFFKNTSKISQFF
jgi:glycosyltransferase involved in cell wall biosynthesis